MNFILTWNHGFSSVTYPISVPCDMAIVQVSQHPELRAGGFSGAVLLVVCPWWWHLAHSDDGDARGLLKPWFHVKINYFKEF